MRRILAVAACGLLLAGTTSCGGDDASDDRTLTVFAAASLATTFTTLADRFEQEHDDVEVRLSFGGSADLAAQIVEGAPADVFAAADERTMATVARVQAGRDPVVFATNTLRIVVPRDNPAGIATLADLADPEAKVVLCAAQVPCGAAARTLLERAGVEVAPVSEEQSVTDVLGKVVSGEADAGLVYRTDVLAAGDAVRGIEPPGAEAVVNRYPIVPLDRGELAESFAAFVAGPQARTVLADAGFGPP